jgi:hypothetical protein
LFLKLKSHSVKTGLLSCLILLVSSSTFHVAAERQITSSLAWETMPRSGNDGISDIVVFASIPQMPDGTFGPGHIWYQRLMNGIPYGPAVQVTNTPEDDKLPDVSGDYIVYTALDSVISYGGKIMLCQISTGVCQVIRSATLIVESRICGDWVVWREGDFGAVKVMLYNLTWLGTSHEAIVIGGPSPSCGEVDIGERFAV